jgi:hypothetical protein
MSKELLLQFAKGGGLDKHLYIVYDVVGGEAKIEKVNFMRVCDNDVLNRFNLSGEKDIPENDIMKAAQIFIENNKIETIEGNPFWSLPSGTEITLNIYQNGK